MYEGYGKQEVRRSECFDSVNFSSDDVLNNVKMDFYDPNKEWSNYERIIVYNQTIIKRTYEDEVDVKLCTEFAEEDGAFEEKMTLPIDFNDYTNHMKRYVERFIC